MNGGDDTVHDPAHLRPHPVTQRPANHEHDDLREVEQEGRTAVDWGRPVEHGEYPKCGGI